MRVSYLIQKAKVPSSGTIQSALETRLQAQPHDCVSVAMAYVSIAGVRTLLNAFSGRPVSQSLWLVGLDDAVSQPGALELLMTLGGAHVRVASLKDASFRFHPKVCRFQFSSGKGKELLMIGSANLTSSALAGNSEAVVFMEGEKRAEKDLFSRVWTDLWSQGHEPTTEELASYKDRYQAAKKARERSRGKPATRGRRARMKTEPILAGDGAELDPSNAATCWIECGRVTAMGRELEFKAEQGLFFGLQPAGGDPKTFRFRTSDGSTVSLRMKYQQNHMWRLQMNNEVPEVRRGLRPTGSDGKLGRPEEVAVFTRTNELGLFDIRFTKLRSPRFADLMRQSSRLGTVGSTTARSYGWC
jgi:HKD family nuclease